MAVPVRGAGGSLGIGSESVWGTPVARTNWKPMVSMGLRRMITRKAEPELGRLGQASSMQRFPYDESDFAGGSIEYVACYDDSTIVLLAHLLGTVATTGSGPYTHTVTLASPVPLGLTLEQISGTSNGSIDPGEVFEGCKFGSGNISLTAGGLLMVKTEVMGQTSAGLVAAATPTYSSNGEQAKHNHAGSITLGGSARAFNSVSIDIDRGLTRNHELGSLFTSEPYEEGLEVSVELRTKWQTPAFDTLLLSGGVGDLVIPITGSGSKALTITVHNLQIWDVTRDVNSRGAIEQVIKGRAFADATDQGLALAFVNDNATATAN